MFPSFEVYNVANRNIGNTEHFRYFHLGKSPLGRKLPYFFNIFISKLRAWPILPLGLPIFRNFIIHIFRMTSNKKMVWIYARRVVTFMANQKPRSYFFEMEPVGKSVGEKPAWLFLKRIVKNPIAFMGFERNPIPASSKPSIDFRGFAIFINMLPKPKLDWLFYVHKSKTPANLKVKPEQCFGIEIDRC